jgi:hypothetical protein
MPDDASVELTETDRDLIKSWAERMLSAPDIYMLHEMRAFCSTRLTAPHGGGSRVKRHSSYIGVTRIKGRWYARLCVDGKEHLRRCASELEAAYQYDELMRTYGRRKLARGAQLNNVSLADVPRPDNRIAYKRPRDWLKKAVQQWADESKAR